MVHYTRDKCDRSGLAAVPGILMFPSNIGRGIDPLRGFHRTEPSTIGYAPEIAGKRLGVERPWNAPGRTAGGEHKRMAGKRVDA